MGENGIQRHEWREINLGPGPFSSESEGKEVENMDKSRNVLT